MQVRSVAAGSFFGRFAPSIGEMLSSPLAEFNEWMRNHATSNSLSSLFFTIFFSSVSFFLECEMLLHCSMAHNISVTKAVLCDIERWQGNHWLAISYLVSVAQCQFFTQCLGAWGVAYWFFKYKHTRTPPKLKTCIRKTERGSQGNVSTQSYIHFSHPSLYCLLQSWSK